MAILGSQKTGVENKGFFLLKVRKFKKMAIFDSWTFELAQMLGNKRKNADFSAFMFSGRRDEI